MNYSIVDIKSFGDHRGSLVALESKRNVPFEIQRVYYIYNTKENVKRGLHAHLKLNQFIIAVSGGCTMQLDDGSEKVSIRLDSRTQALRLGPMIWREMSDFTPDCVLMVLADSRYDSSDYISSYEKFIAMTHSACEDR
jgi:dTDP-4-dehydrorhamnose 3,5-epimerase-like enzyme